ncbi:MAG: tetratricopeptide repeat protein [Anaerolineaceae bacterium]|nr:tetratricopeptide repeat protein [Anaerolineaceae bacterium]
MPDNILDLSYRKTLGRDLLAANKLDLAVELFSTLLRDFPDDVESYNLLGDTYAARHDLDAARRLFSVAPGLPPAAGQPGIPAAPSTATTSLHPADPLDDSRKHPPVLSRSVDTVPDGDIERAVGLLSAVLNSHDPAQQVADHLEEIDALLPALLELNIRKARSDGRPDLVRELTSLKGQVGWQNSLLDVRVVAPHSAPPTSPAPSHFHGKVVMLAPDGQAMSPRATVIAEALKGGSCEVHCSLEVGATAQARPDVVIACDAHAHPKVLEELARCTADRIPTLLDLSLDFEAMPVDHPNYPTSGLGSVEHARAYASSLLLANAISFPSQAMQTAFNRTGQVLQYIPDGWARCNPLWDKPALRHDTIRLGWVGSPGQRMDVFSIRRIILRVLREFAKVQLVIVGDAQVYQMFGDVPSNRCIFYPSVPYEEYPYLLSQVDILLAPLDSTPFHSTLSDRLLMEAGVRSIPWIASPIPAFKAWGVGGVLANSPDEWHTCLRRYVGDADLRTALGQAGRAKAMLREAASLASLWVEAIETLLARQPAKPANH